MAKFGNISHVECGYIQINLSTVCRLTISNNAEGVTSEVEKLLVHH